MDVKEFYNEDTQSGHVRWKNWTKRIHVPFREVAHWIGLGLIQRFFLFVFRLFLGSWTMFYPFQLCSLDSGWSCYGHYVYP